MIRPNLGFLGVGEFGRNRLEALQKSKIANILFISDPSDDCLSKAKKIIPEATLSYSSDSVYSFPGIDGVVIATPSALHAQQAIAAFEKDYAVFCHKPVGRTADEVISVVDASCKANKLLGVDFSLRYSKAFQKVLDVLKADEIGDVYSVDLVFYNAYGPEKPWFYDVILSGGGCVVHLGMHLIDLALYALDFPYAKNVTSRLYSFGRLLKPNEGIEDYAAVSIDLINDVSVNLSCSWNSSIGQDAVIEATFTGTTGRVSMKNVNGSFYDFSTVLYNGTHKEIIFSDYDDWSGMAVVDWAKRISCGEGFDSGANEFIITAEVIDRIYGREAINN
ncbi:MAG: gfo/Idh/MocA family oxidoreductase [Ignavibacteriae bacterium]|nr:MAG: gfo/Idh/MocA family oxidoreductase [Ignavibacteriota bacterium]